MAENAVPGKGILIFAKSATLGYLPVSLTDTGAININGSISAALGAFVPASQFSLSVSAVSASVAISGGTGTFIRNTGSTDCYVKFAATATTSDLLLKAGEAIQLDSGGGGTLAAITASGTTTLKITTGSGLTVLSQPGGTGGGSGGNVNLNQVGGATYGLGAAAMAASMPVTIANDQTNVPFNLKQVNGSAFALGQTTKSASLPVTLASDQGNLPVAVSDRLEVTGTISSAAVLSNFPVTDTSGYRCLCVQATSVAASSTLVVEESNDGTTWSNLTSLGGMASLTAAGLYSYNFSAKQIRVRQSVYGGAGSSSVTAELRLEPFPHDYAMGAPADTKATDSTSSWSAIALLKAIFGALAGTLTVSGTVTANAGTNLNTSALALEAGGNLAASAAALGATTGAAVTTDANGTIQQYLRGLVKVLLAAFGATGSAVPASAGYKGLLAKTALPAAATDGNLVGAMADKFGRQIVRGALRELLATAALNTTGTSGTLLAAQGASVFADMYRLVIANSSAAAVLVTISDGTNSYGYEVPANGTVGFSGAAADATPAASANTAWTYTVASGTTTIYIHAQFVLNK